MTKTHTTIRVVNETSNYIQTLKRRFKYSSADDLLLDMGQYFDNFNISPKDSNKPINEVVKKLDDRIFGFMKTNEEKILKPFISDSSKFMSIVLDFVNNYNSKNEVKNVSSTSNSNVFTENLSDDNRTIISDRKENNTASFPAIKKEQIESIINFFNEKSQPNQRGGIAVVEMQSVDFFNVLDELKKLCM